MNTSSATEPQAPPAPGALPPRRRAKATSKAVLLADKVADWSITVGGLGVIIAVFGIMVFLAEVVVPLFLGGSVVGKHVVDRPANLGKAVLNRIDEYKTLAAVVADDGRLGAFHIATGATLQAGDLDFKGKKLTAVSRTLSGADVAMGFQDGTVRFGKISIDVRVLPAADVPAGLRTLDARDRTDGKAIFSEVPNRQVRRIAVSATLDEPQEIAPGKAIVAVDYRLGGTPERPSRAFVTIDEDGVLRLSKAEERSNMLTGKVTTSVETTELPPLPKGVEVAFALMTEKADQVYVGETSGKVFRYDTRDFEAPKLAETVDLVPGDAHLTGLAFLIGEQSIVATTSDGAVDVFFRLRRAGAESTDGYTLVRAHRLEKHPAAVVALSPSQRGKQFVTTDVDGRVRMYNSTSEQLLLDVRPDKPVKPEIIAMSPREDGIVVFGTDGKVRAWDISVPHPETTWKSIFGKVWYEGYDKPTYTWQSSAATDSFESKMSLTPLIFGTLKATIYSLLFAIPVALLAAIYTSEFVHRKVRATVKPVMEMMASLPSVVLGFIAALILAPIVETWIAAVVLAFVVMPLSLFAGAYAWQLLPTPVALRYGGLPKFSLMFVVLGIGVWLAYRGGPSFERMFFDGDFKLWANGTVGSSTPFMTLLLLPLGCALAYIAADRSPFGEFVKSWGDLPRVTAGFYDAIRWVAMLVGGAVVAWALAKILLLLGFDARGSVVDTYVQRNTLVVGFAMGFAVIPIIYTIAEDALNSVPEHLRGASLACGATPWQTAVRVILPTGLSGVFAAIMVGMGRAVGETMIVVMAAGNTPVLEWNVFSGLRALSANIAVELPEAVKDSTLYRMLFLAALTLFVMTFVVNTLAEIVRLRFRKRTAQL